MNLKDNTFVTTTREIIKRPRVWLSLNVLGLLLASLGLIICISLIGGTFAVQSTVRTEINKVDDQVNEWFDIANESVAKVEKAIEDFTAPKEIDENLSEIAQKNIDRLEFLSLALAAIDFGGRLDEPIARIDRAIEALEKVRDESPVLDLAKEKVLERIEKIKTRISDAEEQFNDGISTARRYTTLGSISIVILAIIFLVGEITLFRRCFGNIRNRKELAAA